MEQYHQLLPLLLRKGRYKGDRAGTGIKDTMKADSGAAPEIRDGEVPVFWACGVTPQMALQRAKPDLVITHAPGHMFITDIRDKDLAES